MLLHITSFDLPSLFSAFLVGVIVGTAATYLAWFRQRK